MAGGRVESIGVLEDVINNPRQPIAYLCQAIDDCISCNWDNLRGFFETCFPTFVKLLFGLDGPSWLSTVAQGNQLDDARALVQLLGPKGNLFAAMDLADRDDLIQYVFPEGRLPLLTQIMLRSEAGQQELDKWPQYHGRLVSSFGDSKILHLNTLQYFLLWNAYYVFRSGQSSIGQPASRRTVFASASYGSLLRLPKQVQAAGRNLVKGQQHPTTRSHPYQSLLQQYLSAFLPRGGQHSLNHASSRAQLKSLGQFSKGDLLFSVLMEFWLTDGEDPALRNPKQDRPLPALPYEPPTDDLLEAMQTFAKRLYRCMRRAINRWPEQRSTAPLVSLYLAYIAPWGLPTLPEPSQHTDQKGGANTAAPLSRQLHNVEGLVHRVLRDKQSPAGESSTAQMPHFQLGQWEGHVLANLPFYQLLFPMLLTLLRSRVSSRTTACLRDAAKILAVFKTAPELCTLLRSVEEEYKRAREQHTRARSEGPHADVLPWIQSQVQAFEAGAIATVRDSHVATQEPAKFLMFSEGPGGCASLVHSLLNRAVGAPPEALRQVEECAQGWLPMGEGGTAGPQQPAEAHQQQPDLPTVKKGRWQQLQFKGDPMHRPVTSREFGFLVRWLVWLSVRLNRRLGLDQPVREDEMSESLWQDTMKWVQRKGYRVNLRYLAERQTLGWLVVIWFTAWGFCRLCQLLGSIDTGSPRQHAPISFAGQRQYVQHRTAEKYAGSDLDSRNSMPSIFDDF